MFVCVKCNQQMRPKKNGFEFVELARIASSKTDQTPYAIWSGDLWECQECGLQIVYTSPSQQPLTEHYKPDFDDRRRTLTVSAKEYSRPVQLIARDRFSARSSRRANGELI
jgi:hypothetical protein